mgnify:FL=1
MPTTDLIPHQTITAICDNVSQAQADIAQAFVLLQGAKERLTATLGSQLPYHSYAHLWDRDISDSDLPRAGERAAQHIARNAWRYVLDACGLKAYMTERRQQELHAQLAAGRFPALTPGNVLSTLQGLTGQVGTLLEESAKEVFDWLRPWNPNSRAGQFKTNQRWKLGYKAIVPYAVEAKWTEGYHINAHRESNFRALGNVFSLLDGQGAQQYPDDLCTQLRAGLDTVRAGEKVTTPYLTLKPYHNHNAHLVFLRHDLVDKLNALCGDGSLPGEA